MVDTAGSVSSIVSFESRVESRVLQGRVVGDHHIMRGQEWFLVEMLPMAMFTVSFP